MDSTVNAGNTVSTTTSPSKLPVHIVMIMHYITRSFNSCSHVCIRLGLCIYT
jgi:hypothetical protein